MTSTQVKTNQSLFQKIMNGKGNLSLMCTEQKSMPSLFGELIVIFWHVKLW